MSLRNRIIRKVASSIYKSNLVCTIDDISISDLKEHNDGFEDIMGFALELIQNHDPRRYKRVRNEINWIVNSSVPAKYGGMYQRSAKACVINFDNYAEDTRLVSAFYAGIIVHEATHGYIETKGIKYSTDDRLQIERICCSENNRFYEKIISNYPEYEGLLIIEFDPDNWEYSWQTPGWKQFFHWFQREIKDKED